MPTLPRQRSDASHCEAREAATSELNQIVAGHHRILAAIRAGIERTDLHVRDDMTDAEAVLIYAAENSTQRGESSTAGTGTVAGATWLIARAIMSDHVEEISATFTAKALEVIRGQIASDKGLGYHTVLTFLKNVPGMKEQQVRDYFANIKSCGEYAKIIADVRREIEEENREAMRQAEAAERERKRAERAAREAEERRKKADIEAKKMRDAQAKRAAEQAAKRRNDSAATIIARTLSIFLDLFIGH